MQVGWFIKEDTMQAKPEFFGPQAAAAFSDQSVVDAYQYRPGYTPAVCEFLLGLMADQPRRVLDAGCGTGPVARALVDHVEAVDAVDVSAAMVAAGRGMPL